MVESSTSFNALECIGQPIKTVLDSPHFKPAGKQTDQNAVFEVVPTKSGNPKGVFYTCRDKGF